jgi:hypothetical protein
MPTLNVSLSPEQAKLLLDAITNETPVKLKLNFTTDNFDQNSETLVPLKLTVHQINQIKKHKPVSFSKLQVKKIQGKALPALIPLLSLLLSGVGVLLQVLGQVLQMLLIPRKPKISKLKNRNVITSSSRNRAQVVTRYTVPSVEVDIT